MNDSAIFLVLAVCLVLVHCQRDTITDHRYSRYYYTTNETDVANCGHFTCSGNSRLDDPVKSNRIFITLESPIFNGTVVRGENVTDSLRKHFNVTYSYNETGNEEYTYTLHLRNLNSSLIGQYACHLGFAASRDATPQLLYREDLNPANYSFNASSSMLTIFGINKTIPKVFDVMLRLNNGSTWLFNLTKNTNVIDVSRWECEDEIHLDYDTRSISSYPCGYIYNLHTINPSQHNGGCVSVTTQGITSSSLSSSAGSTNNTTTPVYGSVTPDKMQGCARTILVINIVITAVLIAAIVICVLYAACTRHDRGNIDRGKIFYGFVAVVILTSLAFLIAFVVIEKREGCSDSMGFALAITCIVLWCLLTTLFLWMMVTQLLGRKLCCRKVENLSTSGEEKKTTRGSSAISSKDKIELSQKHNVEQRTHVEAAGGTPQVADSTEPRFPDVSGRQNGRLRPLARD